jgi:Zn ribbon nucleic-acid-binding protein
MSGLLEFVARFGTEDQCIEYLSGLRWPDGYVCAACAGREAWHLKGRARIYECRRCGHQESVTAGTIFHRTRTGLPKWFLVRPAGNPDPSAARAHRISCGLSVLANY